MAIALRLLGYTMTYNNVKCSDCEMTLRSYDSNSAVETTIHMSAVGTAPTNEKRSFASKLH